MQYKIRNALFHTEAERRRFIIFIVDIGVCLSMIQRQEPDLPLTAASNILDRLVQAELRMDQQSPEIL
ncbi:hypothetical protein D3C78_1645240 [compost metagenome]